MNKASRTQNSLRNLVTGIGSNLVLTLVRFICRTVLIKTLGSAYLGINGLFSNILSMLSLTELGIDVAMNYKLYKPVAENDLPRIRALMKFYKYAYIVVGSVMLVLGLSLLPFLPNLIKDYDGIVSLGLNPFLLFLLFLSETVCSYLFFASKNAILKANQQEYLISIVVLISQFILNVLQIISLLIFKDFTIYTLLSVLTALATSTTVAIIAKKKYPEAFEKSDDKLEKAEIKDLFKDLGGAFIYKVNGVVVKGTDNLILSTFIGLAIVGIYSNYILLYSTIKTILERFFSAFRASLGNLYATESLEKRYTFFEICNFLAFILYGTAAVGITVVTNELLVCWIGNDYVIAWPFSLLMGIEMLFLGINTSLSQIRNVTGIFRQLWFRPCIGIFINLAVSLALVKPLGIYGVVIGTICASVFSNFLIDPAIIHKYSLENFKPVSLYYAKQFMYMAILAAVGFGDFILCKLILPDMGWLSVIVHIIICGVSVPLVFCLVFWKTHECKRVVELVKTFLRIK